MRLIAIMLAACLFALVANGQMFDEGMKAPPRPVDPPLNVRIELNDGKIRDVRLKTSIFFFRTDYGQINVLFNRVKSIEFTPLSNHHIGVVVVHPATSRTEKTEPVVRAKAKLFRIRKIDVENQLASGILLGHG